MVEEVTSQTLHNMCTGFITIKFTKYVTICIYITRILLEIIFGSGIILYQLGRENVM